MYFVQNVCLISTLCQSGYILAKYAGKLCVQVKVTKIFFVSDSFETYGGLSPSMPINSLQSFMAMRCSAAEKCCLKVFKIQQRGYPREIFRLGQN